MCFPQTLPGFPYTGEKRKIYTFQNACKKTAALLSAGVFAAVFSLILFSVICRKDFHNAFKGACKFALAFVAYPAGNGRNTFMGFPEHGCCLTDTVLFHVRGNGKSIYRLKNGF